MSLNTKRICYELNKWAGLGNIGTAVAGLYPVTPEFSETFVRICLFSIFFIFLRLKMFLDDHVYFESKATFDSGHFRIGIVLAILSWVLMAVAAFHITSLHSSAFLLLLALAVSTLWVVADALRTGAYREQYFWIAGNALYMAGLAFLLWWSPTNDRSIDWRTVMIFVLLGVLLTDWILSKPWQNLRVLDPDTDGTP
jgi:hypothetical protein